MDFYYSANGSIRKFNTIDHFKSLETAEQLSVEVAQVEVPRSRTDIVLPYNTTIEFGRGFNKGENAGKMGYSFMNGRSSDGLDIVGAGNERRKVNIWDDLDVKGSITTNNITVKDKFSVVNADVGKGGLHVDGPTFLNGETEAKGDLIFSGNRKICFNSTCIDSAWIKQPHTGPTGAVGPAGAVGPTGAIGPTGAEGKAGAQGNNGPTGPMGPIGPAGATGPQHVSGNSTLSFGEGLPKGEKAGYIGYTTISTDALDIAGASDKEKKDTRKVKIWDDLYVNGQLNVGGKTQPIVTSYIVELPSAARIYFVKFPMQVSNPERVSISVIPMIHDNFTTRLDLSDTFALTVYGISSTGFYMHVKRVDINSDSWGAPFRLLLNIYEYPEPVPVLKANATIIK